MSYRSPNRPVKIPPAAFSTRTGVVLMYRYGEVDVSELEPDDDIDDDYWYSTGSAAYAHGILHPQTQALVAKRRKQHRIVRGVDDNWPRRATLKFIYKAKIKESGETYLIYKHRHIVRYVPEDAQPPRILYGNGSVGMKEPVLSSTKVEEMVDRLGTIRVPRATADYALVDHPDRYKATMMVFPVALPEYAVDRAELEIDIAQAEKEFESTRATPEFRGWFEGASDEVRNEDGSPKVFFRGQTTGSGKLKSRLAMDSFTDSSEIASIYSTQQGSYGTGANIVPVYIDVKNPLVIPYVSFTFYDLLTSLGYWDRTGITHEEATKVLNFLINRKARKKKKFQNLPNFNIQVKNESETESYADDPIEVYDPDDVSFIFMGTEPSVLALSNVRDLWDEAAVGYPESDEAIDFLRRLSLLVNIDVYALIETPAVKRALKKLGYDGVKHMDTFSADAAAKKALGKSIEDVEGIEEGEEDYDWEDMSYAHGHWTIRPLDRSQVWPILSDKPVKVAARAARRALQAAMRALA